MSDQDLRGRLARLLDEINDAGDWPVVTEEDGSRWVDREWLLAEFAKALE